MVEIKKSKQNMRKSELEEINNEAREALNNLTTKFKTVISKSNRLDTILDKHDASRENLEAALKSTKTINSEFEAFEKLVNDIKSFRDNYIANRKEVEGLKENINTAHEKICNSKTGFMTLIDQRRIEVEENAERISGISKNIDETLKGLDENLKEQRVAFDQEFTALQEKRVNVDNLENEIRKLLPSAASAGLASSFSQAKLRYGSDPVENNGKYNWRIISTNAALYFGFIISIFLLFGVVTLSLYPSLLVSFGLDLNSLSEFGVSSRWILIGKLVVASPFVWLSMHFNRIINQRAKLYEEYNYKARLMQSYVGFVDRLEGSDNKIANDFTKDVLAEVNKPPSITISKVHSDSFLETLIKHFSPLSKYRYRRDTASGENSAALDNGIVGDKSNEKDTQNKA